MNTLWYTDRYKVDAWRARGASTLLVPPAGEPVSLDEFIQHSRLPEDSESAAAVQYLSAARAALEEYTGRAFINQTWVSTLDYSPYNTAAILLPKAPVVSVTTLKSYNATDVEVTMNAAGYFVDVVSGRIVLRDGISWPSDLRGFNSVIVTYVAGYGTDGESVPIQLRQAICLLAAHWYEHREGSIEGRLEELPLGVKFLADPFRRLVD